jgi:hypothetical protein
VNRAEVLQPFADRLNPLHEEIFQRYPTQYSGAASNADHRRGRMAHLIQDETDRGSSPVVRATDVLFRPGALARLAPLLLQHGMLSFSSRDVLQFLGHRINVDGQIPRNYTGELTSDFKSGATGDRVKYRISGNSLKGYGKAGTPMATFIASKL